jgi:hypothetical protein
MKICPLCGTEFHPKSNRQKYCGEECSRIATREKVRIRVAKYRKLRRRRGWQDRKDPLGSDRLGPHMCDDFEKEMVVIAKSMRRFKLKSAIIDSLED